MVGLDAAGKTTILYKLKLGEIVTTIPTIGMSSVRHTAHRLIPRSRLQRRDRRVQEYLVHRCEFYLFWYSGGLLTRVAFVSSLGRRRYAAAYATYKVTHSQPNTYRAGQDPSPLEALCVSSP